MRVLALLVPLFTACYSIQPERMVPDPTSMGAQHGASVALDVSGGGEARQSSESLSAETFEQAVRLSIQGSGLFREVTALEVADYLLDIDLRYGASHPGYDTSAQVVAQWTLIERLNDVSVWKHEFLGSGTATTGDSFRSAKRQFIALERAGKAHLETALAEIGTLSLVQP